MRKLRWRRIISLAFCICLLASLSVSLIFADEKETSGFDNFKKVQNYTEGIFTDVNEDDWYHDNVATLYEYKLMIGMTGELFEAENNLKISEAMALASRLNATYTSDTPPEQNGARPWYLPYLTYLRDKEVVGNENYEMTAPITRRQFAELLANSLPEEAFEAINDVKEGMIPDLTGSMEENKAIYDLFRSGVLTGMDEEKNFEPDKTIKRIEAAAIVSRVINTKLRIDLGLPIEKETKKSRRRSSSGGDDSPIDWEKEFFCITSTSDVPITVKLVNQNDFGKLNESPMPLLYSINTKDNWQVFNKEEIEPTSEIVTLNKNDKLYIKAARKLDSLSYKKDFFNSDYRYFIIDDDDDRWNETDARVNLSGNIMSLLDPDMEMTDLSIKDGSGNYKYGHAFKALFEGCSAIVDASNLVLSPTKLAERCCDCMFYGCTNLVNAPKLKAIELATECYSSMFYGCTSLVNAPELPATTIAEGCYFFMFSGCTSLVNAPELPATELADYCYNAMFGECTSLAEAPELPATTIAEGCYFFMFSGCTSLVNAPELPATELATKCYSSMFYGCTSLVNAPELPATTLAEGCYFCMFSGCTSLKIAPALPATILTKDCYNSMFLNCTNLEELTVLIDEFVNPNESNSWLSNTTDKLTVNITKNLNDKVNNPSFTKGISNIPDWATIKVLPEKGDLIYLDDDTKLYRVLNRDGLNLDLLTYDSVGTKKWSLGEVIKGLFSDGNEYPLYGSSEIDRWLNGNSEGDYYKSLSDNIKNAIVEKDITQRVYNLTATPTGDPDDIYFISTIYYSVLATANVGLRNVYMLGWDEIANYFKVGDAQKKIDMTNIQYLVPDQTYNKDYLNATGSEAQLANPTGIYASFTVDLTKVKYEKYDPEDYLCIEATSDDDVEINLVFVDSKTEDDFPDLDLEYSYDKTSWTHLDQIDMDNSIVGTTISLNKGQKVYFRNTGTVSSLKYIDYGLEGCDCRRFFINDTDDDYTLNKARVKVSGNIMSLLDKDIRPIDLSSKDSLGDPKYSYAFSKLFGECPIVDAKDLKLPATKLCEGCYKDMFSRCASLVNAPDLPEAIQAELSCANMFLNCTSLISAPTLPSTKLAEGCYYSMFSGCTSLENAPALPATTLADECYSNMFENCTNLKTLNVSFTEFKPDILATAWWLYGVNGPLTVTCPTGSFVSLDSPVSSADGSIDGFLEGTILNRAN